MTQDLIIIFAALALGGFVKGATGAGMPIVAVPVLASFFDVPFAIAIMVVPTIVTNLWQISKFREERHAVLWLKWMWIMAGLGIVAGTWLLTSVSSDMLSAALGVVVILYIILRLSRPQWHIKPGTARRAAPTAGLISGLLQGATGISAPVSITFLTSIQLARPQFVFAISVLFVGFALVQLPVLAFAGVLTWERAAYSALALIPVAVAMPVGGWVGARLSHRAFDRVILLVLAAIVIKLFVDAGLFG